jgi:hypothetical protein
MFLKILYKKVATNRQLLLIVACFLCDRLPRIPFAEGDNHGAGSGSRPPPGAAFHFSGGPARQRKQLINTILPARGVPEQLQNIRDPELIIYFHSMRSQIIKEFLNLVDNILDQRH